MKLTARLAIVAGKILLSASITSVWAYPFGIKPAGADTAEAIRQYEAFKKVHFSGASGGIRVKQENKTTSEYQGYGMVFAACVGDHESYKALWKYTRTYIGRNGDKGTFPWEIRGSNITGPGTAMDGCIEIMFSLDLAEYKWPGNGYGDAAKEYMDNLLRFGPRWDGRWWWPDSNYILPSVKPGGMGYMANYMAVAWLPRFTERFGDPRYAGPVREAWYKLLEYSYDNYALVGCSLMEDGRQSLSGNKGFCGVVGSGWDRFDAGPTRFQFRISLDYLLYGEPRSLKWAEKLTNFWVNEGAEEDIHNIMAGYNFTDGKMYWPENKPTTISGAGVAAMAVGNQAIADGAWEFCRDWEIVDDNCMNNGAAVWGVLIMSGMLVPAEYDPSEYKETSVRRPHASHTAVRSPVTILPKMQQYDIFGRAISRRPGQRRGSMIVIQKSADGSHLITKVDPDRR
jgi:hypothetical protein